MPFPAQLIARENRGAHAALNEGLSQSRGEYVQFLNSDDALAPARIARMVEEVVRNGADWGFSGTVVDADDRPLTAHAGLACRRIAARDRRRSTTRRRSGSRSLPRTSRCRRATSSRRERSPKRSAASVPIATTTTGTSACARSSDRSPCSCAMRSMSQAARRQHDRRVFGAGASRVARSGLSVPVAGDVRRRIRQPAGAGLDVVRRVGGRIVPVGRVLARHGGAARCGVLRRAAMDAQGQ